jgi:hypothetical protein
MKRLVRTSKPIILPDGRLVSGVCTIGCLKAQTTKENCECQCNGLYHGLYQLQKNSDHQEKSCKLPAFSRV